jgi:hypothetical protein
MNAIVDRRGFLGSAAAVGIGSVGLASMGGLVAANPLLARTPDVTTTLTSDPVHAEIVRQFVEGVDSMQGTPSAEAARRLSSMLTLLAEWGKTNRVDDLLRTQLQTALRQHGRDVLLANPFDLRDELTLRGWRLPPGSGPLAGKQEFGDALDDMLAHGITQHWIDYATAFGDLKPGERMTGRLTHIGLQQNCYGQNYMLMMLESQAFIACTLGIAIPEFCVVASGLILSWRWYMWYSGC